MKKSSRGNWSAKLQQTTNPERKRQLRAAIRQRCAAEVASLERYAPRALRLRREAVRAEAAHANGAAESLH